MVRIVNILFISLCIGLVAGCDSPFGEDGENENDKGPSEDTSPPAINFIPGDGTSGADVDADIQISFNEPVRMLSDEEIADVNVKDLIILKQENEAGPDVPFDAEINPDKTAITVNPEFLDGFSNYYIQLSPVEDSHDNASSQTSAVFQTGSGVPEGLVINEIFYDASGSDSGSGELFVEIYGPSDLDLSCYRLSAVNGADGDEYRSLYLNGTIPSDGFFVLVQAVQDYADMVSTFADLQNGPDSLVLYRGTEIADAVGYGSFGEPDNFKGEGNPAPDASEGNAITRDSSRTDTDENSVDFSEALPTPGS